MFLTIYETIKFIGGNDTIKVADTMTRKVAVLVINFNGRHHLKRCFDSMRYQTYYKCKAYVISARECSQQRKLEMKIQKYLGFSGSAITSKIMVMLVV